MTVKPSSPARLLKVGAVVLISGAMLLLFGAIGAFYFWKGSDNEVSPGRVQTAGRGSGPRGAQDPEAHLVCGVFPVTRMLPARWSQSIRPHARGGHSGLLAGLPAPASASSRGLPGHFLPSSFQLHCAAFGSQDTL